MNYNKFKIKRCELKDACLKSPLNIDLIRSIIINDFYTGKPKSIKEKKEFARRLLHSPLVSQEYVFVED